MKKGYLKTKDAAEYLSVDESFLKKNMHSIFEEGVHFFRPSNARLVRWRISALDSWIAGCDYLPENEALLKKLLT